MSDSADETPVTRAVTIYNLTEQLPLSAGTGGLDLIFDIGESQRYLTDPLGLLPRVLLVEDVPARDFCGRLGRLLSTVTVTVLRTPRGDPLVVVESRFSGSPSVPDVVGYREQLQESRDSLAVAGTAFNDWLGAKLSMPAGFRLGYGHTLIFVGGELAERLLADETRLSPAVQALLIEDTVFHRHNGRLEKPGFRSPPDLNTRGSALVAHTRGASVIAGWNRRSEDKMTLVVVLVIAAFAVLYRARIRAYRALDDHSRSHGGSIEEARETLTQLADEMGEIQLDLSFGVEAYVDSVLIPDNLMQLFRASLYDQLAVATAAANTARMVERLGTVIQSRGAALVAAGQEVRERQDRVLTGLFAVVSVLAVPPGLLLSFFSVNSRDIDPRTTIFDLHRYWGAYVLAFVPFTTLIMIGLLLARRERAKARTRKTRPDRRR
ncbi:hypothetical protein ABH935_008665 [Catenulispora sp. GAS73]|uniref:hypothetical protein n=1 Tax=Catenulispora sp. GAS73 TaxID=3156269 RepID=UPI0035141DAA